MSPPVPLVIAHRGASAYEPENSRAAFRRAIELGADGIELDVHETADGDYVVLHDATVAGRPVHELDLHEVCAHRLANGEPIPTLRHVLDDVAGRATVFIEVKASSEAGERRLLDIIDRSPAPRRCQVHAFDHRIVHRLVERRPRLKAGVLSVSYVIDPVAQVTAARAETLWQQADAIDGDLVTVLHQAGLALFAWTVDDPAHMRTLAALAVDAICTNTPDVAREVLA